MYTRIPNQNVSVSVKVILNHKVYHGVVYFEVESSVDEYSIVEFLNRSDLLGRKNGFEAMERYINEDLTLPVKQALLNLDPLLILFID